MEVETQDKDFKEEANIREEAFPQAKGLHFINANTNEVDMGHLKEDCIVPVFSKDNELTVSHPAFIETVHGAAREFFRGGHIGAPEIMVSHIIKGRTPEAVHKPASQLLDCDRTIY